METYALRNNSAYVAGYADAKNGHDFSPNPTFTSFERDCYETGYADGKVVTRD